MRYPIALILSFALAFSIYGAEGPSFDVASIKPATPPQPVAGRMIRFGRSGGPGTTDPGQITWSGASLMSLITEAYNVKRYQVTGPDWLNTDQFDVIAKVPAGATKEQVAQMWQNLLAERFGLQLHHDSKSFSVDELVIAKGGAKLKKTNLDASVIDAPQPVKPPAPPRLDNNNAPQLDAPGLIMMMRMGPSGPEARMVAKAQTLSRLADMLGNQLNKPVVDKTGLTDKYDFTLDFAPEPGSFPMPPGGMPKPPAGDGGPGTNANEPSGLPLPAALQQQLGLRLESTKAPLDVLIIEHANRTPTEN